MKRKDYHEYKMCCICKCELTKKSVYGGFMGFFCRLFGLAKNWQTFSTCQKCRDYTSAGFSLQDIIQYTDRWNKYAFTSRTDVIKGEDKNESKN